MKTRIIIVSCDVSDVSDACFGITPNLLDLDKKANNRACGKIVRDNGGGHVTHVTHVTKQERP